MWQNTKNIYHFFVAVLANIYFGFPGRSLKVIGVTGTDGKTTTVSMIHHILKSSGFKVAMLSTINSPGLHVTTPSPFGLQSLIKKSKDKGSEYFVLEVTSHALDQNRVWGIPFQIGAVTNVTREHLDYHETFENYLKTKKILIKNSKAAVLNIDDKSFKIYSKGRNFVSYGLRKGDVNLKIFPVEKIFKEEFNQYNALCAATVCRSLGLDKTKILSALQTFKLPLGRLDLVFDGNFKVVVDFAHTPNAFEKVLKFLRSQVKGRIIHVFGSAGERDKEKRSLMGKISSKYADLLVLTVEDPRRENPSEIIDQIKSGIKRSINVSKILDRKEAIRFAISGAKDEDLVLITGKAHEKSMNLGRGEEPWDEFKAVNEALKRR